MLFDQTFIKGFTQAYPTLHWEDLQYQNEELSTNDGCIHFLHKSTQRIYSWKFLNHQWIEMDNSYQQSLMKGLFES
jgi:hypothetical protein